MKTIFALLLMSSVGFAQGSNCNSISPEKNTAGTCESIQRKNVFTTGKATLPAEIKLTSPEGDSGTINTASRVTDFNMDGDNHLGIFNGLQSKCMGRRYGKVAEDFVVQLEISNRVASIENSESVAVDQIGSAAIVISEGTNVFGGCGEMNFEYSVSGKEENISDQFWNLTFPQ